MPYAPKQAIVRILGSPDPPYFNLAGLSVSAFCRVSGCAFGSFINFSLPETCHFVVFAACDRGGENYLLLSPKISVFFQLLLYFAPETSLMGSAGHFATFF